MNLSLANNLTSNEAVMDANVTSYGTRVVADGGSVIDLNSLNTRTGQLKAAGLFDDLVGWWPHKGGFDLDGSNYIQKWYDVLGNNDAIQGTANARPLLENSLPKFDGVDDYVGVEDFNETGNNGQELSVFMWVKATDNQNFKAFGGHWDSGISEASWLLTTQSTTDKLRVLLSDDGTNIRKNYYSGISVFDNTWHHVGVTWNNGSLELYIDGVNDTSVTKTTDTAMSSLHDPTAFLTIGGQIHQEVFNNGIDGLVDEVMIFNIALNQTEITNLYNLTMSLFI